MARARNSMGRFTRRASPRRFGLPTGPVSGTESSGVVTGETVTLGGATEPEPAPTRTTKSKSTAETTEA